MITKNCLQCGKEYRTRERGKFCSLECSGLSGGYKRGERPSPRTEFKKGQVGIWKGKERPEMRGRNNPKWVEKIFIACVECKKEVQCTERVKRKFCSHSCRARYWFRGKTNPHWNGGNSKWKDTLKSSDEYKDWRMKVFQRDRFTCRWCGFRSKKSKPRPDIEANHIYPLRDYRELALKVENGITLCVNCHRKTYGKEMKLVMVFKEILNDYMTNKEKS